jgi:signal-transduction protein with cAMP-binding, CBS, and nucleotidyltransferase domain
MKPETSLSECIRKMVKNRVGSLIIEEKGMLKGFLTEKDIMWAISKKNNLDLSGVKGIDVCTRKIKTIRPTADISDALLLMRRGKYRRLPVVVKGRVIGLITMKDLLILQPELFRSVAEGYNVREQQEKLARRDVGKSFTEGVCEECGTFDILYSENDILICESCRESM